MDLKNILTNISSQLQSTEGKMADMEELIKIHRELGQDTTALEIKFNQVKKSREEMRTVLTRRGY